MLSGISVSTAGYQREAKSRSGGSPWTKTEVTLSSEWKTSELRHAGIATASGPPCAQS